MNPWAANQNIRIICEGSCDTEENSAIIIIKYIQMEISYLKL